MAAHWHTIFIQLRLCKLAFLRSGQSSKGDVLRTSCLSKTGQSRLVFAWQSAEDGKSERVKKQGREYWQQEHSSTIYCISMYISRANPPVLGVGASHLRQIKIKPRCANSSAQSVVPRVRRSRFSKLMSSIQAFFFFRRETCNESRFIIINRL